MLSDFESTIRSQWKCCIELPGVLRAGRAGISRIYRKQLGGHPFATAICNPDHEINKRGSSVAGAVPSALSLASTVAPDALPTAPFVHVNTPFDPSRFHFGKAQGKEVVALLDKEFSFVYPTKHPSSPTSLKADGCSAEALAQELGGVHAVFVNVSPVWKYHCLFVPYLLGAHTSGPQAQIMNFPSLLAGVQYLRRCSCAEVNLGFNSLGAFASVNHLHFHVIECHPSNGFCSSVLPISRARRQPLCSSAADRYDVCIVQWPVPAFSFELRPELYEERSVTMDLDSEASGAVSREALVGAVRALLARVQDRECSGEPSEAEQQQQPVDILSSAHPDSPPRSREYFDANGVVPMLQAVAKLVALLQSEEIAHQIYIIDGGDRVLVVPRLNQSLSLMAGRIQMASCEIAGLAICNNLALFDLLDSDAYVQLLQQHQVEHCVFAKLKAFLVQCCSSKIHHDNV